MKLFLGLCLVTVLLFTGCQDSTSPLSPQQDNEIIYLDDATLNKNGNNDYSHLVYDLGDIKDYKVKASKNFKIEGKKGGKIELKIEWKDENDKKVKLEAKLEIPKEAYEGEIEFDMIFNLREYNLELYPSPFTFEKDLDLDMKFENVNLAEYTDEDFDFDYIDDPSEKIKYKKSKVDVKKGKLEVENALIPHFSRYGWSRRR